MTRCFSIVAFRSNDDRSWPAGVTTAYDWLISSLTQCFMEIGYDFCETGFELPLSICILFKLVILILVHLLQIGIWMIPIIYLEIILHLRKVYVKEVWRCLVELFHASFSVWQHCWQLFWTYCWLVVPYGLCIVLCWRWHTYWYNLQPLHIMMICI